MCSAQRVEQCTACCSSPRSCACTGCHKNYVSGMWVCYIYKYFVILRVAMLLLLLTCCWRACPIHTLLLTPQGGVDKRTIEKYEK